MSRLQDIWRSGAVGTAGGAVAIALSAPALAADIPARFAKAPIATVWSWTGFYGGVNLGWGFGESTGDYVTSQGFALQLTQGTIPRTLGLKPDGVIGGGQFGYNWQNGAFVFGIEADIQASNVADRVRFTLLPPVGFLRSISTGEERLQWFGTVRGRLGVAPIDRALVYVTGGLAYGGVNSRAEVCLPLSTGVCDGQFIGALTRTQVGWTLGGGAEYAWTDRWSMKLEYLYLDLGSDTVRMTDPIFPADFLVYRFEHRDHVARVGLNYKFK
jgi:outer membrane immunogenic protein